MAIIPTTRFVLKKYDSGGDPHPSRAEFNTMIDTIENNAGMFSQGVTSARPAAGKRGRSYWDTDAKREYYDDGVAWSDKNPNGGGGAGRKIVPGSAAEEGVSARSARADHTHALDLATPSEPGAMSPNDKAKLDGATASPDENTLMRRSTGGRTNVGTPTSPTNATTKAYVDGLIGTLGTESADYADAAVENAPTATSAASGKMSSADKAKLDAATSAATGGTVAMRDTGGRISVGTPTAVGHSATKAYVDGQIGEAKGYADEAVAGIPLVSATVNGRMSKYDKIKLDAATAAPTADTIALRDSAGRVSVGTPTTTGHSTTKAYVDGADTQTLASAKTYADEETGQALTSAKAYTDTEIDKVSTPYTAFTPTWAGFSSLGTTGLISQGQYTKLGPNTVRADLRLKAGTGAALGNNRISVTLPFAAAGNILQMGGGALLPTGPAGALRKVEVVVAPGLDTAEIWATAVPTEGLKTPGAALYPFAKDTEIHVSITYHTEAI